MLYDLVMEKWHLDDLWGIVLHLAGNPDARHEVASAAALCSKAAHAGDKAALRIYERAALDMSLLARTVIRQHRDEWDGTVTIMGGAWKGHPSMFNIFKQEIELLYPEATVSKPLFEPVVGCAVLRCLREGITVEEMREPMINGFMQFQYP
jgi:N-acetylglucosamine kinase-like BadF-type ATPase